MRKSHQHPLPKAEYVFLKLNGRQLSTQINFVEAYMQIVVEEESEMLTIYTYWGLFKFNNLPSGVESAPSIFQQIMDTMISGL